MPFSKSAVTSRPSSTRAPAPGFSKKFASQAINLGTAAGAAPPQFSAESKFMQNFRVASGVNAGAGLNSVRNAAGLTEYFSIGTDQQVHNYYPDPSSDTGYSTAALGVTATSIGTCTNAAGNIVVFASNNLALYMVTEQPGQASRWSQPQNIPLKLPTNALSIASILTTTLGTATYLAFLVQTKSTSPSGSYGLLLGNLDAGGNANIALTSVVLGSLNCVWTGVDAASASLLCADGALVAITPTGVATRLPMQGSFVSRSVCGTVDGNNTAQVYAVLNDGNAYRLLLVNGSYSWGQLTQSQGYTQISAATDTQGNVHLLTLGGDTTVSHLQTLTSSPTGFGTPAPILANTAAITLTHNSRGDIQGLAAGTGQGALQYLLWDSFSTAWQIQALEVAQGTAVETYSSYGTDVKLLDGVGSPLPNTSVQIWSTEPTFLTINGGCYFVDGTRTATVSTNAAGMLNIEQGTSELSVPPLLFTVPGLMAPGDSVTVQQDTVVQQPLSVLTGTELLAATTASGQQVLPTAYRTQEQADAVAQAVSSTMLLAASSTKSIQSLFAAVPNSARVSPARAGVHGVTAALLPQLRSVGAAPVGTAHWRFWVDRKTGTAKFTKLDDSALQTHLSAQRSASRQALALSAQSQAGVQSVGGFFDVFESIGDIVTGVVEGIVDVVETVVSAVGGAIQTAITFIVDGVQYLYESTVSAVEQLFEVAELVFAQVKVFFNTLFEWLGFLFNWSDMVRTAKAMAYTMNQSMAFLSGAAAGIQNIVDDGINELQAQVTNLFNSAMSDVGQTTTGSYANQNTPDDPQVSSTLSNNPMYNMLLNNPATISGSAQALMLGRGGLADDPLSNVEQALTQYATSTQGNPQFSPVSSYYTSLGGASDNLFSALLSTLLTAVRDLVNAVLSGAKAAADALLQSVQSLMQSFAALLNEDWDVPVLSQLFSWATDGMPMSTINLMSLIMAIPATVLYKAIYNASPFADDAAVAAFESAWSGQTLLQASGLAPTTAATDARATARPAAGSKAKAGSQGTTWTGVLPQATAPVVALLGAVSQYFSAGFTAVVDAVPGSEYVQPLSVAAFVTQVGGTAASCPWLYKAGSVGCSDGASAGYLLWTYGNLNLALDLVYLNTTPAQISPDARCVIKHLYGDVQLIIAIIASQGKSPSTSAGYILSCIPKMAKLLRLSSVVTATEGISLAVLAGCDIVCIPVAATIACVNTINAIAPTGESQLASLALA